MSGINENSGIVFLVGYPFTFTLSLLHPGPGCSKLMTSLVNMSLKFQTLISQISRYFFVEKLCEAFALPKLLSFLQQKISVHFVIKW